MVPCVFRSDNGKIFRTEAEAVWHEQHVLALGKLEALLVESYLIRQAKQEQSVVNEQFISLTVSYVPCVLALLFQAAGAAGQEVDEADGEAAADAGNRMRHVPLRPGRHRAAGSPRVSQVP
jgi:hypothetical protein